MYNRKVISLFFAFILGSLFFLSAQKVSALPKYATGPVIGLPENYRQLCTSSAARDDFAVKVSNVKFTVQTSSVGVLTYNIHLQWSHCDLDPNTRQTGAYAIYGSSDVCPLSGWYGTNGATTDCVKYVGAPPSFTGTRSGLECDAHIPGGRGADCVSSSGGSVLRYKDQPTFLGADQDVTIPMSKTISMTGSSGHATAGSNMCQYYKVGPDFTSVTSYIHCQQVTIDVPWYATNGLCSVSAPTALDPGQAFTASFGVYNIGQSNGDGVTWNVDGSSTLVPGGGTFRLGYRGSSAITASNARQGIRGSAVVPSGFGPLLYPNKLATWTDNFTAPTTPGVYTFSWQLLRENDAWFGNTCSMSITVRGPTCTITANPSSIHLGESSTLSWSFSSLFNPATMTAKLLGGGGTLKSSIAATETYDVTPSVDTQYAIVFYSSSGTPIGLCGTNVYILPTAPTNHPYVRASTNDVWSGAVFAPTTTLSCDAYNPADSEYTKAISAQMQTNTKNGLYGDESNYLNINKIYQSMLGRAPDASGLNYMINTLNGNVNNIISSISGSSEYRGTGGQTFNYSPPGTVPFNKMPLGWLIPNTEYAPDPSYSKLTSIPNPANGSVYNNNGSNKANWIPFVTQLYRNAFGREPDSEGLDSWTTQLANNTISPNSIIRVFVTHADSGPFGANIENNDGIDAGFANYGGSGAEYAAFSIGKVNLDKGSITGFVGYNGLVHDQYTDNSPSGLWRYDLVFSSVADRPDYYSDPSDVQPSSYGYYDTSPLCLPDYYDQLSQKLDTGVPVISSAATLQTTVSSASSSNPQIINYSGTSVPTLTVPAGKRVIIVSSASTDVTVSGNITISDASSAFTLVRRGNLIINSGVNRLDGMYIAQPTVSTSSPYAITPNTGIIQTCNTQPVSISDCASSLKVNGALIAQRLKLYRTYGSIGYALNTGSVNINSAYNTTCLPLTGYGFNNSDGYKYLYLTGRPTSNTGTIQGSLTGGDGTVNDCAAEWINFDPSLYLHADDFSPTNPLAQSFVELPPIY